MEDSGVSLWSTLRGSTDRSPDEFGHAGVESACAGQHVTQHVVRKPFHGRKK